MLLFFCKRFVAGESAYIQQPDIVCSAQSSQRYSDDGMMRRFWIVHDEADVHALANSLSARQIAAYKVALYLLAACNRYWSCLHCFPRFFCYKRLPSLPRTLNACRTLHLSTFRCVQHIL